MVKKFHGVVVFSAPKISSIFHQLSECPIGRSDWSNYVGTKWQPMDPKIQSRGPWIYEYTEIYHRNPMMDPWGFNGIFAYLYHQNQVSM